MKVPNIIKEMGFSVAYSYLDKNPEENLPKLLDMMEKIAGGDFGPQIQAFRDAATNQDGNWFKLIKSVWTDIDDNVRHTLFNNFFLNASLIGWDKQEKYRKKYGCNIPWAILMDPTSACNLKCIGCWAAEYGNRLNMSFEQLDDIVRQGKEMGTYMYIFSGGEPLVRKKDIIRLCEKHDDCEFLAFTNATLIDEEFANEMLRVTNFIPAISVEGFKEATDARRGEGTFDAVMKAMRILKEKKLPFGVSCCYTSQNYQVIGSEEYFDAMIDWGAKFAWFFTYMPVGADAVPELMATPEQRKFMYDQVRKFRDTKAIFTMDFWNDGEFVNGCIAGGRNYLHINANGDIEPCAFVHYSDSNIKEKTLLEAYQSPLFMAYKEGQPFNENHLRPCPVLDNPHCISHMVHVSGAHSTDLMAPEDVDVLAGKCQKRSEEWGEVADDIWRCNNCPNFGLENKEKTEAK